MTQITTDLNDRFKSLPALKQEKVLTAMVVRSFDREKEGEELTTSDIDGIITAHEDSQREFVVVCYVRNVERNDMHFRRWTASNHFEAAQKEDKNTYDGYLGKMPGAKKYEDLPSLVELEPGNGLHHDTAYYAVYEKDNEEEIKYFG